MLLIAPGTRLAQHKLHEFREYNPDIIDEFEFSQPFKTIQLKCPDENSVILQQIRKDSTGKVAKTRYKIEADKITKIIDEIADPGKGFRVLGAYDLSKHAEDFEHNSIRRLINQVGPLMDNVCAHSKKKELFELFISINNAQPNHLSDDHGSKEPSPFDDAAPFKTVGVRCPIDMKAGILEQVKANTKGYIARTKYMYQNGKFTHVLTDLASPGGNWKVVEDLYFNQLTSQVDKSYLIKLENLKRPVIDNYCLNPGNAKIIDVKIHQHRKELKELLDESAADSIDWIRARPK